VQWALRSTVAETKQVTVTQVSNPSVTTNEAVVFSIPPADIPNNSVSLGTSGGCIDVTYRVAHPTSTPFNIVVEYSLDSGANWLLATQGGSPVGGIWDGVTGVTTSPGGGTTHRFRWDSFHDQPLLSGALSVPVRVRATLPGVDAGTSDVENVSLNNAVRFTPPVDWIGLGAGMHPRDVIALDFNNDGFPDVATSFYNSTAGQAGIRLSRNTIGGMGFHSDIVFGGDSTMFRRLAVGDFNGDGFVDLAASSATISSVSVFRNDGFGGFSDMSGSPYNVVNGGEGMVAGDLDGNGRVDLVTTQTGASAISVLTAQPTGTAFQVNSFNLTAGTSPSGVALGDFNRDGRLDVVTANRGSGNVSVFLQSGTPTEATRYSNGSTQITTHANNRSVVVADFNRDGRDDIAAGGNGAISILLGAGGGVFSKPNADFTMASDFDLAARDIDHDGKLDLVSKAGTGLRVLYGNGNGTFGAETVYADAVDGTFFELIDLENDGQDDVLFSSADSSVNVPVRFGFRERGCGFVGRGVAAANVGNGALGTAVADLNRDGKPDVITSDGATDLLTISMGLGDGNLLPLSDQVKTEGRATFMAVGDVNNDKIPDLLVSNNDFNGTVIRLIGNGAGGFINSQSYPTDFHPATVVIADFNGDGEADFATANSGDLRTFTGSPNTISVRFGVGGGEFGDEFRFNTPAFPLGLAAGDLDGDGLADLAVGLYTTGGVAVLFSTGSADEQAFEDVVDHVVPGALTTGVGIANVIGDSNPDIIMANSGIPNLRVVAGTGLRGEPIFGSGSNFIVGDDPKFMALADSSGSSAIDITLAVGSSISDLRNLGTGAFTNFTVSMGRAPIDPRLADFNGDHRLDVVAGLDSDGFVGLMTRGSDGTLVGTTELSRPNVKWVDTADVDGNGTLDLVYVDSSFVTVQSGNGDGTFGAPNNLFTTSASSRVYATDLNKDGYTDLVTFDGTTVTVFVQDGTGWNGQPITVSNTVKEILFADMNRDGWTDMTVYNGDEFAVFFRTGSAAPLFNLTPNVNHTGIATALNNLTLADVNRDGAADYVITTSNGGANEGVGVLLNDGAAGFAFAHARGLGDTRPIAVTVADVNRDGGPDVVMASRDAAGRAVLSTWFWESATSATVTYAASVTDVVVGIGTSSSTPAGLALRDLDGDQRLDAILTMANSSAIMTVAGSGGTAPPFFAGEQRSFVMSAPLTVSGLKNTKLADLNRDGKLDIFSTTPVGVSILLQR
jgi:hypothetical protein